MHPKFPVGRIGKEAAVEPNLYEFIGIVRLEKLKCHFRPGHVVKSKLAE